MASLIEGTFVGKAVPGTAKVGPTKGKFLAVVTMEVTEGEHKGRRFNYEGKLDEDNIRYTKRDLMALGWKGQQASKTLTAEVDAAALTISFEVEIARWNRPEGGVKEWNAVRSIGRGGARQIDKMDADQARNVDKWFDAVPANGGDNSDVPF